MTDLTKITTAFGLLDEETRAALEEHHNAGLPTQVYTERGWGPITEWLSFGEPARVFRAAPLPPTRDELAEALRWVLSEYPGKAEPRIAGRALLARYDEIKGDEA